MKKIIGIIVGILVVLIIILVSVRKGGQETYMTAEFVTNKGTITLQLFDDKAPQTVENFTKLVRDGFYDTTKFHRVIDGFMIQGGDPQSKDDALKNIWGSGGPGYTFNDEIYEGNHNDQGTIAMANAGPNTNGSQFFINLVENDYLDSKHTVFGKVTRGFDVVEAIGRVATDERDRPIEPVIIEKITISGD